MGEKLNAFIDFFNKKADALIEEVTADLEEFKAARKTAIAITSPGTGEYKTLGDLVAKIIPENGEVNSELYKNLFTQMSLEDSDKATIKALYKTRNAPTRYQISVNLKGKGEEFFNAAMRGVGSALLSTGGKTLFKDVVGDGSDEGLSTFREFINESDDFDENIRKYLIISDRVLRGKSQGREFYDAVIENGDPIGKKEEAKSTINPPVKESAAGPTAGPINPPEGEKKAEAEKSTVNPVAAPPTETAVEKTTGTVTGTPTALPKEAEAPKPSTAINISVETPAGPEKAPTSSVVGPTPQPAPTAEIGPKPLEKTTVTSEPIIIEPPTKPGAAPPTGSPVNEEKEKKKQEASNAVLGSFLGIQPTGSSIKLGSTLNQLITEPSPTTNTTQVSNTSTQSTINQSTVSTTEGAATTTNQAVSNKVTNESLLNQVTNSSTSALANRYFKSIFSPVEEKKKSEVSEKVETSPQTMSETSPEIKSENTTEVIKTSPSFPEKIQPSSEKIIEKANSKVLEKTQEMMNQKEMVKAEMVSSPEKASAPAGAAPGANEAPQAMASPKTSINMDGIEARLSRLEYLLSNPLEVKIVE